MERRPELSPRLRKTADLVPDGVRLTDVGTDHAYLPAALILEGRIPRALATDIRSGPLERARQTAALYGLEDRMEFRQCDGLEGVQRGETDAVVIAGMGGETIAGILAWAPWTRRIPLILQPMSSMPELREWLQKNGYTIERESLAREGRLYYTALSVRGGTMAPLTPAERWCGRNTRDPLRGEWLDHWTARVDRALGGLRQAVRQDTEARIAELEEVREGLVAMRKEWENWQS